MIKKVFDRLNERLFPKKIVLPTMDPPVAILSDIKSNSFRLLGSSEFFSRVEDLNKVVKYVTLYPGESVILRDTGSVQEISYSELKSRFGDEIE